MDKDFLKNFPDPDNDEFETVREQNYAQIIKELLSGIAAMNTAVMNNLQGKIVSEEDATLIYSSTAVLHAVSSVTDSEYELENQELTDIIHDRIEKEYKKVEDTANQLQEKIYSDSQS